MKRRAGLAGTALIWIFLSGCDRRDGEDPKPDGADPTAQLPAKYKNQDPVPPPNFGDAAKAAPFRQAIRDAAALLGAEPQALLSPSEAGEINGGVSFDVPQEKVADLLRQAHADFLARGFYLFRHD